MVITSRCAHYVLRLQPSGEWRYETLVLTNDIMKFSLLGRSAQTVGLRPPSKLTNERHDTWDFAHSSKWLLSPEIAFEM